MPKISGMSYIYFNNNPLGKSVGDCVIRAVSKATDKSWGDTYWDLADYGYRMADMPSSNAVWGQYLMEHGFKRRVVPNVCPNCYTVQEFARNHPDGIFVVSTGSHAVTIIDENTYDSWDSSLEVPSFYFWRP